MSDGRKRSWKEGLKEMIRPLIAWCVTYILGIPPRILYRLRFKGRGSVPRSGPVLLAANHVSWVDPILVMLASPRRPVRFLVTTGFHKKPFVHFFAWVYRAIPIRKDQPREAIRQAIEALKQGDVVCIFPEGGLTKDGELREILRGVELIARSAKAPVLPLRISGLFGTALTIRREWRREHIREKPWPKVELSFGSVIPWDEVSREEVGRQLRGDGAGSSVENE